MRHAQLEVDVNQSIHPAAETQSAAGDDNAESTEAWSLDRLPLNEQIFGLRAGLTSARNKLGNGGLGFSASNCTAAGGRRSVPVGAGMCTHYPGPAKNTALRPSNLPMVAQ